MASLNEYPELKAVFEKLMAEKEAIFDQTKEMWSRYNKLQSLMEPHIEEQRELQIKIKAIERPRVGEIVNQLSAIARAIGGRATSDRIEAEVIQAEGVVKP